MADRLLQTRVPPAIARSVKEAAARDGDPSTAAWLRRLLTRHFSGEAFEAWMSPRERTPATEGITSKRTATYRLREVRRHSPEVLELEVRDVADNPMLLHGVDGERTGQVFVLRGSATLWQLIAHFPVSPGRGHVVLRAIPWSDRRG